MTVRRTLARSRRGPERPDATIEAVPRSLHDALRSSADPLLTILRVVDAARSMIAAAQGVSIDLVDGAGRLCTAHSQGAIERIDDCGPDHRTLALAALTLGRTQRCDDLGRAAGPGASTRSLLCVPLFQAGTALGVLRVAAPSRSAFDDRDVALLDALAEFVASVVASAAAVSGATGRVIERSVDARSTGAASEFVANVLQPGMVATRANRDRIERIISDSSFDMLVQPIVKLGTHKPIGFEALTLFHGSTLSPDKWFASAYAAGLGVELERAVVHSALQLRRSLPQHTYLAINVGSGFFADPAFLTVLDDQLSDVVFEITEQAPIVDYPTTLATIDHLRRRGARIAVDDTGAGFANLAHLLHLRPDIVKLDRDLIIGIEADAARQALVSALVDFCATTGASIVAEGIEHNQQISALQRLGVGYGQGFHIARPAPTAIYFDRPGLWSPPPSTIPD
jgi:EAL domain-containing protein (putative c-di-GMP-specific phosphodiesterase class I)